MIRLAVALVLALAACDPASSPKRAAAPPVERADDCSAVVLVECSPFSGCAFDARQPCGLDLDAALDLAEPGDSIDVGLVPDPIR